LVTVYCAEEVQNIMITRSVPALMLLLLSACASLGGGEGSQLTGRAFVSTEITGRDLVTGTRLQLAFPETGKFTANTGCNHLFGDVSFDGGRLSVSETGSTAMGCDEPRQKQDDWLIAFLKAGPALAVAGDNLVLTGNTEVIKFVDSKAAKPDNPLLGTRWAVESLIDGQSVGSVPPGAQAFLQFTGDTVTGADGCNQLSGKAVQGPNTIVFADILTTKKACTGDNAALAAAVLATLNGQVSVKIEGDLLELRTAAGKGLQLRAVTDPRPTGSGG
jgi:heat shock protein HslJ